MAGLRTERCACGAVLRWPADDHAWPRLQMAHNRTEQHILWRTRTEGRPHIYEEHIAALVAMPPLVRRVA